MATESIFYQLFEHESCTYTYIIADPVTKEAAIIDPVIETVERDLNLIKDLDLKLKYILDTHVHADHVTGAGEIRKRTGAKTAVSADAHVDCVDITLQDGQVLQLGGLPVVALTTPGHTDSCMSFVFEDKVFTGDALLIRGTGRTDFQQGSAEKLYDSIYKKLFVLPGNTKIYPGHDYRGQTHSTIELERKLNPRLGNGKTKSDFVKTMSELKLANPKKIHEAISANLACGRTKDDRLLQPTLTDGVPEVPSEKVHENLGKVKLIDVRRPEEFNNELGHIPGADLIPMGEKLDEFLANGDRAEEIVFVCRSGSRSFDITAESLKHGYKKTANLMGGMIAWNQLRLPVERNGK